jgi:hypothetical protein
MCAASARGPADLPAGYEIVEFAVNDVQTGEPAINNCGEIVYVKDRFENSRVYLYDNGKITRLTDYNNGLLVFQGDINDAGTIVWMQAIFNDLDSPEVVVRRDGEQRIVAPGGHPRINGLEHMAWQLFRRLTCNIEQDIIYYDGETMTPITDNQRNNQSLAMNNHDWIAWGRYDFCVGPYVSDIELYAEGGTQTLPAADSQNNSPDVNDRGVVVWNSNDGVHIWENGVTRLLTDWDAGAAEINGGGEVFFWRWHNERDSPEAWLYRPDESGGVFHRLTDDWVQDTVGDLNDHGEAAWRWYYDPRESLAGGIRFLRRIRTGDGDFDGDVDLDDAAALHSCRTGPGRVDRLCDCRFLDIDHDGDVDLADFARVQQALARN